MLKKLLCFGIIILLSLVILGCQRDEISSNKINFVDNYEKQQEIETKQDVVVNTEEKLISWYKPLPGTSWQWQLSGEINTNYDVEVYDLDLVETSQNVIDELHNKGVKVICYFNAGSFEEFRDDASLFPKEVLGNTLDGWEDEKWLDISNYEKFSKIMEDRLDLAVKKNCDGVEPDNVDGYSNNNGFGLTYLEQLEYNKWLANEAHKRGLAIALKNDLEQVNDLVNYFDFAVNEQCFEYDECELLLPFITQNKAVFGVEYESKNFCKKANAMKFSWLQMDYDLDGGRSGC